MTEYVDDGLLDQYSKPRETIETKLSIIFLLNPRDSKKGRLFMPVYDERFLWKFQTKYAYISKFLEEGNTSGNHYHKVKEEILIPLQGRFEICLEDIKTKEQETICVESGENKAIYIGIDIAHKIKSKDEKGILLVLASNHSSSKDEIDYSIQ